MLPEEGVITQCASAGSARLGPRPRSFSPRAFGPEDGSGRERSDLRVFHQSTLKCLLPRATSSDKLRFSVYRNWCDGEALDLEAQFSQNFSSLITFVADLLISTT